MSAVRLVVDVREERMIKPEDAQALAVTERACAEVGWRFRRVGAPPQVLAENLRWLAGYRAPILFAACDR